MGLPGQRPQHRKKRGLPNILPANPVGVAQVTALEWQARQVAVYLTEARTKR